MTRLAAFLLLAFLAPAAPVFAQSGAAVEVDDWGVYGASGRFARDDAVPGQGVVRIASRAEPGEPWASAASVPVATALGSGERINAVFWARADRPARAPVLLRATAEPYPAFAATQIALTPEWQRFTLTGIAPRDLAAGSQVLSIQLGQAGTEVSLGPVLLLRGEAGAARIEAAAAAFRPTRLAQDVTIASDQGVTLAGTLRTPTGRGAGPFPVALMLAGGGPSQRGVFDLLADRLLADGIATLEYDKRGVGQSTGQFLDRMDVAEVDAAAAVAWLRTRPDIDPERIALVGLSQGAVAGPAVAARDSRIAAVVALAGPVGERGTLFLGGVRAHLAERGTRTEVVERTVAAVGALMEAHNAGTPASAIAPLRTAAVSGFVASGFAPSDADAAVTLLETPALLSMYESAPAISLAALRMPVLALYAALDETVSTPIHLPAARRVLSGNPDATVRELAGLNHSFQIVEEVSRQTPDRLVPPVSSPEAIALIGDWLDARLNRERAR